MLLLVRLIWCPFLRLMKSLLLTLLMLFRSWLFAALVHLVTCNLTPPLVITEILAWSGTKLCPRALPSLSTKYFRDNKSMKILTNGNGSSSRTLVSIPSTFTLVPITANLTPSQLLPTTRSAHPLPLTWLGWLLLIDLPSLLRLPADSTMTLRISASSGVTLIPHLVIVHPSPHTTCSCVRAHLWQQLGTAMCGAPAVGAATAHGAPGAAAAHPAGPPVSVAAQVCTTTSQLSAVILAHPHAPFQWQVWLELWICSGVTLFALVSLPLTIMALPFTLQRVPFAASMLLLSHAQQTSKLFLRTRQVSLLNLTQSQPTALVIFSTVLCKRRLVMPTGRWLRTICF